MRTGRGFCSALAAWPAAGPTSSRTLSKARLLLLAASAMRGARFILEHAVATLVPQGGLAAAQINLGTRFRPVGAIPAHEIELDVTAAVAKIRQVMKSSNNTALTSAP